MSEQLAYIKQLIKFLGEYKWRYLFYAFLLYICGFYMIVPAWVAGKVVDTLNKSQDSESLQKVWILVFGLGILHLFVSQIRLILRKSMRNIYYEVAYRLKITGFNKLLDFSLAWHEDENTGNKVQRLSTGINSLNRLNILFTSGSDSGIITVLSSITGVLGVYLFVHPLLGTLAAVYLSLMIGTHLYFVKKIAKLVSERNNQLETASGKFYEGLSNVLTIKSLGAKGQFRSRIASSEDVTKKYDRLINSANVKKRQIFQIIGAITISSVLYMLVRLNLAEIISIGSILTYWSYQKQMSDTAWEVTDTIDEFQEIKLGIKRMLPILDTGLDNEHGDEKFPVRWQEINISNAVFSYKSDKDTFALNNVSLEVKKGEKIGIAGFSGSGKSTLVKILLGLYKLQAGSYTISGKDFYQISYDEIANYYSIVLQESELFNYSLLENITLFSEFSEKKFAEAIKVAQLEELIAKLPQGLDTMIGEKGYRVSGGERQRIGIARAVYKQPEILILDEATSHLDSKTEAAVQEELEKSLPHTTMITIAHRLSTLKNADKIYVFDKGKVVETGGFNQLISQENSRFAQMYKLQSKDKKD